MIHSFFLTASAFVFTFERIFSFFPKISSVDRTNFIIAENSLIVKEIMIWSFSILLKVTCFSIIVAPKETAIIGAKKPKE